MAERFWAVIFSKFNAVGLRQFFPNVCVVPPGPVYSTYIYEKQRNSVAGDILDGSIFFQVQSTSVTMVEENLRIQTFTEIPSPEIFSSQIEPKSVPAVTSVTQKICISEFALDKHIYLFALACSPLFLSSFSLVQVFKGCIKNWKAFSKWNPSDGGLIYLQVFIFSFRCKNMIIRNKNEMRTVGIYTRLLLYEMESCPALRPRICI